MALVLQDRVQENSASSGTGSITLGGAYPGYRTFASCIPDGSIVYYAIQNTSTGSDGEWEVGYGTYTLGTDTLSRDVVYSSSNAGSLVNFTSGAGGLQVFITYPSEQAVFQQPDGVTQFNEGPIVVVGANSSTYTSFTSSLGEFYANTDGFAQMYAQNLNSGSDASTDIAAYNDLGDGTYFFVDMGITSSTYSSVDYPIFGPNDAYLYNYGNATTASRLLIGTESPDANVVIFAGGVEVNNTAITVSGTDQNATFANSISVTANVAANNINVTNYVYSGANIAAAANSTVLVTQAYVDNATSAGLSIHPAVRLEHPGNLAGTYNNGTAGVGATLTNNSTQVILTADGVEVENGDRVLFYEQTDGTENGVYVVTDKGSISTNWVLTRAGDADSYGVSTATALGQGSYFFVQEGDTAAGESYVCSTVGTIVFGTTDINFSQFSASLVYQGASPINVTGSTISLDVVPATLGGTGTGTVTTGDLLYGSGANTWGKLAAGAGYKSLVMNAGGTQVEWNAVALNQSGAVSGALPATNGGTGQTTYTLGDIVYSNATNTLAKLAGQTTTTQKFLSQTGDGANSAAPVWDTIPAGSITGLGTMSTQNANAVAITGGAINGTLIGNASPTTATFTTATATSFVGSGANLTNLNASNVASGTIANIYTTAASANGASTIVTRDASGNFAANTITATLNGSATSAGSATTATTATNLAGGAAGSVPYQTSSGVTAMLATGSGVLVGGATPSYSTAPALTGTNFTSIPNSATTATSANTASAIVARDASGNFTAGTVTATHVGDGSGLSSLNASNLASGTVASARIAGSYTGITGVGTLAAGTWNGATIGVAYGGTGLTATPTNGQIDIGNGTGFTRAAITAGTGVTVTNGAGSITIAAVNNGTVTSVSGTAPIASTGGATPVISISQATTSTNGYLSSADWNTFNNKTSNTGTVTSVSGTGTASGLSLSGTVTTSGNLTLSGTVNSLAAGTYGISISGNAGTATTATTATTLTSTQANWNSTGVVSNVVGMLGWKNYGNSHVIFDASAGTSPSGSAVNNTNSAGAWTPTYPTLMGWNGGTTYGVRVDSARVADNGGVTSIVAGSGISISGATGAVTISSAVTSPIPAGTIMLFAQTSAPTGWTKNTSTGDNSALRVTTGTVGTGGSVAFTTAFASQTPTGSVSITAVAGSAGATTLTTPQIPSHTHNIYNTFQPGGPQLRTQTLGASANPTQTSGYIVATGGGGSHTHPFSFSSGSGTFSGSAINLAVQYIDVIRATKD